VKVEHEQNAFKEMLHACLRQTESSQLPVLRTKSGQEFRIHEPVALGADYISFSTTRQDGRKLMVRFDAIESVMI
jgi:hypothetical protein